MKLHDLAVFSLQSLWQQKLRTFLNIIGVLIAAYILVFTFAAGEGIQRTVTRIVQAEDYLRTIIVYPEYGYDPDEFPDERVKIVGSMSDEKRNRIRQRVLSDWQEKSGTWVFKPLTPDQIDRIRELPHVESIIPNTYMACVTEFNDHQKTCEFAPLDRNDTKLAERLVMGRIPSEDRCNHVLVSEYLAYLWGYRDDDELVKLIGKTVTLHFRVEGGDLDFLAQYAASMLGGNAPEDLTGDDQIDIDTVSSRSLSFAETTELIEQVREIPKILAEQNVDPETIKLIEAMIIRHRPNGDEDADSDASSANSAPQALTLTFKIAGVIRGISPDEKFSRFDLSRSYSDNDIWLPVDNAMDVFRQYEHIDIEGFSTAKVVITDDQHLETTTQQISDMELSQNSLLGFLKHFQEQIAIGKFAMASIAAVVFFVSGLGITNTMIMSVMERRFEIGVLKAIGARNRQIVAVFLTEGAMIGILGSGLAIGLALISATILDDIARQRLENRMGLTIEESVFVFSPSLVASVVVFSSLVTLIATLVPAWRAASVDPIVSLRSR